LNRNLAGKAISNGSISIVHLSGIIGTHLYDETLFDDDIGSVSELVSWSILEWSDGSAGDVFTLGVKISHGFIVCLFFG